MAKPKLATDINATPMQMAELADDATAVTVGLTSSVVAIPSGAEAVRVALSVDSSIRFGLVSTTVTTSNGHYFPKGVEPFVVPNGATHIAVISYDGSSTGGGSVSTIGGYDN